MLRRAWDRSGYVKNFCYLPYLHRRQSQRLRECDDRVGFRFELI